MKLPVKSVQKNSRIGQMADLSENMMNRIMFLTLIESLNCIV